MLPDLQPAKPDMAAAAAVLIYLTMGKMADYLFGADDAERAQAVLQRLFRAKANRFSYQYADVLSLSGEVAGLAIAYSGRRMKSLELPMALRLIRACGGPGFLRFLRRASPLFGLEEAQTNEYFISNIAVLPEQQGRGLGKHMLRQIEHKARQRGFGGLSLTVEVDNERARSLYRRLGFRVVDTVEVEALRKSIGYSGYQRMRKELE